MRSSAAGKWFLYLIGMSSHDVGAASCNASVPASCAAMLRWHVLSHYASHVHPLFGEARGNAWFLAWRKTTPRAGCGDHAGSRAVPPHMTCVRGRAHAPSSSGNAHHALADRTQSLPRRCKAWALCPAWFPKSLKPRSALCASDTCVHRVRPATHDLHHDPAIVFRFGLAGSFSTPRCRTCVIVRQRKEGRTK